MRTGVALPKSAGQLAIHLFESGRDAIAAVDPDHIGRVPVTCAEPAAVRARVLRRDDRLVVHVVAPGRQHRKDDSLFLRELDEPVDVAEVDVVRRRRIVVQPGLVAILVRHRRVDLGAGAASPGHDRLHHREALLPAVREIGLRLFSRVLDEERPRRVAKPEERLAGAIDEIAPVGADANRTVERSASPLREKQGCRKEGDGEGDPPQTNQAHVVDSGSAAASRSALLADQLPELLFVQQRDAVPLLAESLDLHQLQAAIAPGGL